jgi:hypothetical protein
VGREACAHTSNASTRYCPASELGPTALLPLPPLSLAEEAARTAPPLAMGAPGCPNPVLSDAPTRPLPPACPKRAATRPELPLPRDRRIRRRAAAPTLESLDSTCPDMVMLRPCARQLANSTSCSQTPAGDRRSAPTLFPATLLLEGTEPKPRSQPHNSPRPPGRSIHIPTPRAGAGGRVLFVAARQTTRDACFGIAEIENRRSSHNERGHQLSESNSTNPPLLLPRAGGVVWSASHRREFTSIVVSQRWRPLPQHPRTRAPCVAPSPRSSARDASGTMCRPTTAQGKPGR